MRWNICFADREYAREIGDPDLGQVEADTQEEAIEKAKRDPAITRRAAGHCVSLWAYPVKASQRGR